VFGGGIVRVVASSNDANADPVGLARDVGGVLAQGEVDVVEARVEGKDTLRHLFSEKLDEMVTGAMCDGHDGVGDGGVVDGVGEVIRRRGALRGEGDARVDFEASAFVAFDVIDAVKADEAQVGDKDGVESC